MKRACLYGRVSTSEQRESGSSLETQVQAMLDFAEREGYEARYVFKEDYSGQYLERPELNKAKELAREGKIDTLLVFDWDRLSRDSDHQIVLRWMFDRWATEVISISEPRLDGIRLKMQRGMDAIFAEWEKEKILERTTRGKRERARQGKLIGGYFLYGTRYDRTTGKREKDSETWSVLLSIFRMIASGYSLSRVAEHLEGLSLPAPCGGKSWHISTLSRIIQNRAYLGETYAFMHNRVEAKTHRKPLAELRYRRDRKEPRPRDQWIEISNATPALIPLELFEAAQERLRGRAARYVAVGHTYLLTGMVRCGCGARMHGATSMGYRYYRCFQAKRGLCAAHLVRADELEDLIWQEVKSVLLNPEMILRHLEGRAGGEPESDSKERAAIEQRLARLDMEERRLYRLYASGKYDQKKLDDEIDRMQTEREALQQQSGKIEKRLEAGREFVERGRSIQEYCHQARENIEHFDFEQKRLALDALNVMVLIEGKSVALNGIIPAHFDLPIPNRGWRWGL